MDIKGDFALALAYLGCKLLEFRLHFLRKIQSELVNSLRMISHYGLPIENNRFLNKVGLGPGQGQDAGRSTEWDIPKNN